MKDAQAAVDAHPHWYHTMELAPGVVTPGWFDLRPTIDAMPWPDVSGKRCLDVGTYDGQLAFELERRGAAEVVATDVAGHEDWDWPVRIRERGIAALEAGPEKGRGFAVARDVLGSSARREAISVYELSPERMGEFDVVVCGSLLLHLREPIRALSAIRSVCRERFLSAETIVDAGGDEPLARFDGTSDLCHWWTPNQAGHRRMVEAAGFDIERATGPYEIPLGPAHPPPARRSRRQKGILHAAVLARPVA